MFLGMWIKHFFNLIQKELWLKLRLQLMDSDVSDEML